MRAAAPVNAIAPLRVLIVDDEPLAIERLQTLCARITGVVLAGTASNAAQALRLITELRPDAVLLDIGMPEMDGMQLARLLREMELSTALIFVTAYDNFAVSAFEVRAADYLLKPVGADRLAEALARVQAAPPQDAQGAAAGASYTAEFWVPNRGEILRLPASAIDLIEAERDYMRLHAGSRSYLLHETITALEKALDPADFIRIHRSAIVARRCIAGLRHDGAGNWEVVLEGRGGMRVGRSYAARVRDLAARRG